MKKTLALLLCFAMLFTLLSANVFAFETPSVSIGTGSVAADGTTKFTINLEKFDSLKGIDVKATVSNGLEITGASSSSLDAATLKAGEDYVINAAKTEIHIVSLTKIDTGAVITVNAKLKDGITEAQTIDVTACDLAKSGTDLYTVDAEYTAAAQVEVVPNKAAETSTPILDTVKEQPTDSDWFIPYGGIYSNDASNPSNVVKNEDGTFNLTQGTQYTIQEFKVPTGGFGTYAVADTVKDTTTPAKKFCNLVSAYTPEAKQYGSIVIVGDWDGFLAQYEGTKNASELIALLEARYTEKMIGGDTRAFIPFAKNGKTIRVYKQPQTKHLWKGTSQLEYGVRVSGLENGKQYAIVAYNCNKGNNSHTERTNIAFATDIKSAVYTAVN